MGRLSDLRSSPSTVIALVALFVALGGTGYAAIKLPASSVGAKQLKNGAVTTTKIKRESVTSAKIARGAVDGSKVRANSLTGANINAGTLGKVPSAAAADTAANATHATGADTAATAATATALASVAYRADTSAGAVTVPACGADPCTPDQVGTTYAIAVCPGGTIAIGGGGVTSDAGVELSGSFPSTFGASPVPNAWEVDVDNWRQVQSSVHYFVVCAKAASVDG